MSRSLRQKIKSNGAILGKFVFFANLLIEYSSQTYRIDVSLITKVIYSYICAFSCIDQDHKGQNEVQWGNVEDFCCCYFDKLAGGIFQPNSQD